MTITNPADIAARTILVTLTQGAWRATRLHKAETREENARHGITDNKAKVMVRISDHPALTAINKLQAAAYNEHKRLTLPTIQDGFRLLPAGRELEHAEAMRKFTDEHNKLVAEFLADYDAERASAPERLNGLFDSSMWPSHNEIEGKFHLSTQYLPAPTEGAWGQWLADSAKAAEDELHDKIKDALERVRDRCRSDGKLFSSVFDSIRELADLVPDLDFGGSYTTVVEALEPLTHIHAEDLRDNESGKEKVANKAADILSVLGGIR